MSPEPTPPMIPTPRTDSAQYALRCWQERADEAANRGSHLDSDDPRPPDGWLTARTLERENQVLLAALVAQEEADDLSFHLDGLWAQRAVDSVEGFVAPELERVIERLTGQLREMREKARELRAAALANLEAATKEAS